jgi:Tfp pilus assembly protein PilO
MRKLNSREIFILAITLALILVFSVDEWVVKPMHEASMDINDQLVTDRVKLIKARQLVAQKGPIEARYRHWVDLIGTVDSEEAQVPAIVAKIETAARESSIHIGNIQPQKMIAQKEVRFLGVELEIDGKWLDIVEFIYLLQQRPGFYFIDEFNLEKDSNTTDSLRGRIVVSRLFLGLTP